MKVQTKGHVDEVELDVADDALGAAEQQVDDGIAEELAAEVSRYLAEVAEDGIEGARLPEFGFEPCVLGPTWRRDPETGQFVLPRYTLGWEIIKWCEDTLLDDEGAPWRFTPEQRRFILWLYEVDERGKFVWRQAILQRLKGWGKDPLAAVICIVEMIGPCRWAGWTYLPDEERGIYPEPGDVAPVARENRTAWVQIAAVSKKQTKNTMLCFGWLLPDEVQKKYRIQINAESVTALNGKRRIEAVTSNPRSLEGNRPSFVIMNETHHWIETNRGHDMAEAIERNGTKAKGGAARRLSITNAYAPHENSVAQKQREAWEAEESGEAMRTGVLYDSLEAWDNTRLTPWAEKPRNTLEIDGEVFRSALEELTRAWLSALVTSVRGDAWWLDIEGIVNAMLSGETSPSTAKRFWLNVSSTPEDVFINPAAIRKSVSRVAKSYREQANMHWKDAAWADVDPSDEIVMFGDGSKSDDSTALVGCRISDGYTFLIGVWQKPKGGLGKTWRAPRIAVDLRVREAFERFNIIGFWFDNSHREDDEDGAGYWDSLCDQWMSRYAGVKLKEELWSVRSGPRTHAVIFDMTSHERQSLFVRNAEMFRAEFNHLNDIEEPDPQITICGSPAMVQHLRNARQYPTKWGISIGKESRDSSNKVDVAVCASGARMMRRIYINKTTESKAPKRKGAW